MNTDQRTPTETGDSWAAVPNTPWDHSRKQSFGQWLNQGLILLFYLALALAVWFEIPAWMEVLGMRPQSAGGGAAMVFLFFGIPLFLAACLLFFLTALLPKPATLQWAQRYRKQALLILLAWHVAFFLFDFIARLA